MKNKKHPLIFLDNSVRYKNSPIRANFQKQNLLLKGMLINVGDVKQAAKYAGIKTMAEAYRTLDQLSLRKSYYESLDEHNVSLDYIVKKIKDLADNADLDSVKLKALQVFLKTLGLESYSDDGLNKKGWEETLIKAIEDKEVLTIETQKYEVVPPKVPTVELEKRKAEDTLGKELYDR